MNCQLTIVLLLAIVELIVGYSMNFSCLDHPDNCKCRFGALTPYRYIATYDAKEQSFPQCKPKKIWLYVRHGTRYPFEETIGENINKLPKVRDDIVKNYNLAKCQLTKTEVKRFADWRPVVAHGNGMKITKAGEEELLELGKRFQARFPTLMPKNYSNDIYKFKHTGTQRAEESAKNFAIGLFGTNKTQEVWYPDSKPNDLLFNFDASCKKWMNDIYKNPETYNEVEKFKSSSVVTKMLAHITDRVGSTVDYEFAELIRETCIFETAYYWNNTMQSPWCALLSQQDFEIFEFIKDLYWYWSSGYGYYLTYTIACPVVKDMFDFFGNKTEVKTSAYFGHSEDFLKLLSLLRIGKDDKKLFSDSFSTSKDRKWRTSLINAFASNIAFISYDCDPDGPSILTMHQERIITFLGCPESSPCPLNIMKQMLPISEDECDFINEICSSSAAKIFTTNNIFLIIMLFLQLMRCHTIY